MANVEQVCVGPAIVAITFHVDVTNMTNPISEDSPLGVTENAPPGEPTSITVGPDEILDWIETMEAQKLMPPIEVLEKMAIQFPPPQSWFDEEIEDIESDHPHDGSRQGCEL